MLATSLLSSPQTHWGGVGPWPCSNGSGNTSAKIFDFCCFFRLPLHIAGAISATALQWLHASTSRFKPMRQSGETTNVISGDYRVFESSLARQYIGLQLAQAALRPRFLWGVAPKAPDCGRGISPQNPSQPPFISKPPDFFGLGTAAWVFCFRQKRPRTLMNGSSW